ncbi:hypothetical protein LXA43DRAFT_1129595 [Ganoderma leucocontextum]|nr:hypothetical protein LXA43DRAFT_1129595 [Ganoderma leucocontextum]
MPPSESDDSASESSHSQIDILIFGTTTTSQPLQLHVSPSSPPATQLYSIEDIARALADCSEDYDIYLWGLMFTPNSGWFSWVNLQTIPRTDCGTVTWDTAVDCGWAELIVRRLRRRFGRPSSDPSDLPPPVLHHILRGPPQPRHATIFVKYDHSSHQFIMDISVVRNHTHMPNLRRNSAPGDGELRDKASLVLPTTPTEARGWGGYYRDTIQATRHLEHSQSLDLHALQHIFHYLGEGADFHGHEWTSYLSFLKTLVDDFAERGDHAMLLSAWAAAVLPGLARAHTNSNGFGEISLAGKYSGRILMEF